LIQKKIQYVNQATSYLIKNKNQSENIKKKKGTKKCNYLRIKYKLKLLSHFAILISFFFEKKLK